jgi:hypothetical protein
MAKESKSATGLVAANHYTKDDVPGLLEKVVAQIAKLKGNMPEKPQTTGDLSGFGKIEEIKDLQDLIKAHSSVVTKAKFYDESAAALIPPAAGVKTPKLLLDGHPAEAWIRDIQARVMVVAHQNELEKLEKVKAKLEENLSAEAKLAKDLGEIATILTEGK